MQGRRLRNRYSIFRPLWIGSFGLLLVALTLGFYLHREGVLVSSTQQAHNVSPASAFTIHTDPEPLQKVSTDTPSTSNGTVPTAAGASNPAAQNSKTDSQASRCTYDLNEAQKSYNHEVDKEKNSLENTLSFKVGLNISSQYVSDYNKKVTSIFKEYQESAESNHCVWPIKEPALLPSTYTH